MGGGTAKLMRAMLHERASFVYACLNPSLVCVIGKKTSRTVRPRRFVASRAACSMASPTHIAVGGLSWNTAISLSSLVMSRAEPTPSIDQQRDYPCVFTVLHNTSLYFGRQTS